MGLELEVLSLGFLSRLKNCAFRVWSLEIWGPKWVLVLKSTLGATPPREDWSQRGVPGSVYVAVGLLNPPTLEGRGLRVGVRDTDLRKVS